MTSTTNATRLESIGVHLPADEVGTDELVGRMETAPAVDLATLTGIENRRVRSDAEDSLTITVDAAEACLDNSAYEGADLDVIVFTGITRFADGDDTFYLDPPMSSMLKREIGAASAMHFDITNACAGMATGVYIVDSMIRSGAVETGMVVSGECITPIADTAVAEIDQPVSEQFASLTVGDAGACVILDGGGQAGAKAEEAGAKIELVDALTVAEFADLCTAMPSTETDGPAMYTDAVQIHQQTIDRIGTFVDGALARLTYPISDVDYFIPHQTSRQAIENGLAMFEEVGDFENDEIPEPISILEEYGNTASTTLFVALHEALREGEIEHDSKVALLTFASGIVIGAIVIDVNSMEVLDATDH